jgi:hypothetical protein
LEKCKVTWVLVNSLIITGSNKWWKQEAKNLFF